MTQRPHPAEITLFGDHAYEALNVPAETLLSRLKPEIPGFMARILSQIPDREVPTYLATDQDDLSSGFLVSLKLSDQRMSLRISDDLTSQKFGPLPGHFGVFFVISYTGAAVTIPDLTILVPVDLDGRPDHEAWLESPARGGIHNPPRREIFRSRERPSTALYDLVEFLVEQGIAHRKNSLTPGACIAPGVYKIDPAPAGIGPSTLIEDSRVYKLWSRLLTHFETSYRSIVARHYPQILPMCWPSELILYPMGLFANLKLPNAYAKLTVESRDLEGGELVPLAKIHVTFHTNRLETSDLTIRCVIDTDGAPTQILSCFGYTATGQRVHEHAESPALDETHRDMFERFIAYLTDRMINHHEAVYRTKNIADSIRTGPIIDYADDEPSPATSLLTKWAFAPTDKAPAAPSQKPVDEKPCDSDTIAQPLKIEPGRSNSAASHLTKTEPPPTPLFTPLDAAALASKTAVKIYDFEALERELAAQPPPAEDGDRPSPSQIQMISRLHRLGAEGATRWLEHGHAAMIEALADVGRRAPHFGPVTDFILTYVRASANTGAPLRLPPTLIVDEPGTGKTWYLSRIAAALGVPFATVSMAAITTGDTIQGSHPIWRNASQGIVSKLLLTHAIANGVVFVDEFDKPTENGGPRGSLYRPYYAALERENARSFTDDFLGLAMNASHLIWVLAANAIEPLPEPIQDRVTQVKLAPMTTAHRRIVAASIYRDCNADYAGWYQPEIGEDALAVLEAQTPRQMRKALDHALARAGADERRNVTAADLKAGLALSEIGSKQAAIGFTAAR